MKKLRRLFILGLLMVALLVPMAVPVMADWPPVPTTLEDAQREIQSLRNTVDILRRNIEDLLGGGGSGIQPPQPPPTPQPPPPPAYSPMVRLLNPHSIVVMPSEVIDVTLTIRNIGTGAAHSFLANASAGDAPFLVEFRNNSNTFSSLSQNSQRQMTLRITVDENAEPGTHSITLNNYFRNHIGTGYSSTETISVRIGGEVGASNVRLGNIRTSVSTLGPDQSFEVTADLQNMGTLTANNVQISVGNLDASEIFLTSDLNQAFFSTLEAGQTRQVSFTFQTARNIPSNVYQLDFRLTYEGSGDRLATPFFVTVFADYVTESANVEMRGLTATTGRLNVGQTGQISFELVNTGDAVAQNIIVTATSTEATALVPTTSNRQSVQSLDVGAIHAFEFGFMPTATSQTQSYAVQLRVQYSIRGAEEPSSFVQYIALNVFNPEADETPTPGATQIPRVIVYSFPLTPQIPRAGQNFDMEITFLNTSSTRSVNNIRVTLEATETPEQGAVFTPVGGSNTLFVAYLAPGGTATQTVSMFTIPDAPPRVYAMRVHFEYQDEDYYIHESTELLSIPVAQFARLETEPPTIFFPEFMSMWDTVELDFQIINSGRVLLHNMRVRIDGPFNTNPFGTGDANLFMGQLRVGHTNFYRRSIQPLEEGLIEGALVIYGEDDTGEIVEVRQEFAIEVMGGGGFGDDFEGGFPGGGFYGDDMMFEGGAFGRPGFGEYFNGGENEGIFARILAFVRRPLFWGPAVGVVVAAVVTVVVLVRRKKSRLLFDDDDAFN